MTQMRGIRGAITIEHNEVNAIKEATIELIDAIMLNNQVETDDISHVIFTLTNDLDAAFPAKFAREHFDWNYVPMMCYNELNIANSLKKCIRTLVVVNTTKKQSEIKHIYLRGAKILRPDL